MIEEKGLTHPSLLVKPSRRWYKKDVKEINMWIENVAAMDIPIAYHHDAGPNSMLIQISESGHFPKAKFPFKEFHQFLFSDVEKGDDNWEELGITVEQAKTIAGLLTKARYNKMNVVVHCHAGICRSGAVVEVGVMMGFQDTGKHRTPNLLVKHRLLEELGMAYDPNEQPDIESWRNYHFMDQIDDDENRKDGDI